MDMIAGVANSSMGFGVSAGADPSAASVERFQALMNRVPDTTNALLPPVSPSSDGLAAAEKLANDQDAQLRQVFTDVQKLESAAPDMSVQQVSMESIRLQMEIAAMQFGMEVKMGLMTSSRSAAETLMKNQ